MEKKENFNIRKIKETKVGSEYHINLEIPVSQGYVKHPYFVIEKGKERISYPLKFVNIVDGKAIFESDIELETRAIYRYYFFYTANDIYHHIKRENLTDNNQIISEEMYKMSVNFNTPRWAQGKMMYHIFIDRFRRGSEQEMEDLPNRKRYTKWSEDEMIVGPDEDGIWNIDFYGGDLKGIIKSLDYIKSLGVSILYLSPVCESQSTHRYDTTNYLEIDPYAGTKEDLKRLCDEAHKRGMYVVLDAVFNHVGNDSIYFDEYKRHGKDGAYQNLDSPYAPFFRYKIENGEIKYHYWWGMTNMPSCYCDGDAWRSFITGEGGVIDNWFKLGIDGLRLDVADELSDDFIERIRTAVKRNKEDGFIIGEVWKDPTKDGRGYIENGRCMDSVMNYQLIDGLIRYFKFKDTDTLSNFIRRMNTYYPDDTIFSLMNFTSTHDISRLLTILGSNYFSPDKEWSWNPTITDHGFCKNFKLTKEQYELAKQICEAYSFVLATMPGIFSVFYGDEIGIEGLGNLANRKPYPWGSGDLELQAFYKSLGQFRCQESQLERARVKILYINEDYFMYERINGNDKMLFAISNSFEPKSIVVPDEYKSAEKVYSLKRSNSALLTPYGGVALKLNNNN